ncbi:50S ribosomal protein L13, partial [uncultured Muribaculum sp.]|uniref:50S ribosomal protein L13 n=1 Tax=uncultured Muribaculum sp. TaxID=1918613 RepID=UPI0025B7411B
AIDQVLGRLCAKVALILRGKNKPTYSPFVECGDNVIIINADKVRLTGKKMTDREYLSYTGYPGGQRVTTPELLMKKAHNKHIKPGYNPLFIKVMKGMLPKNRLGRRIIENMHVYLGPEHPHAAQNPKVIDINTIK